MTQKNALLEAEVVIVGAGPVGLMMALLLARQGLRSLVVERYKTRHGAPKAHALNPRSLEICHALGLDVAAMAAKATPAKDGGWVRFVTTLTGREIGALAYERQDEAVKELTPTPLINIAQPDFENCLLDAVAQCPLIELRRGHVWQSCIESDSGVTSRVLDSDQNQTHDLRSRYLVAADGAASAVRSHMKIPMCGDGSGQAFITIHFSANLRAQVKDRPAILYWVMQPPHAGVLIAYDIDDNWCMLYPYDPAVTPREHFTEAACADILRSAIVDCDPELEVKHILPWMMMSEVAERYSVGNVFLVGDAAHRFPPTGGLGLNTGIQDAHNLAWKIAAVENWRADPALLGSYEMERKAVALTNSAQSHKNAVRILGLQNAITTDSTGKFPTLDALLDDPDAAAEAKRHVDLQGEHFDSLALQLGFVYGGETASDGNISNFIPRAVKGARLPHVWVNKDGKRISTLDLLDDKGFTLLLPASAAASQGPATKLAPLKRVMEGSDFTDTSGRFGQLAGFLSGQSLLVRPDGHIAAVLASGDAAAAGRIIEGLLTPSAATIPA